MKALAFMAAITLGAAAWGQEPAASRDSCVECHALLDENLGQPAQMFQDDEIMKFRVEREI